jgi:TRAP-type C4-dicarboxylate transport system substrate-binding protein
VLKAFALIGAGAVVAAGCTGGSGSGEKAGGSGAPVVLTLAEGAADSSTDLAVLDFVRRVGEISGGALRIQVTGGWGGEDPGAEQQTVRDVGDAKMDLGSVGTRVFDTLGVNSFEALGAPMLIDSYPLERAVIASDIPGQMLASLGELDLTGLAVLGGGLRKPIAVERALLGPSDWQDINFAGFRSQSQAEAVQALGALPSDVIGGALTVALGNGQVQGAENNLLVYEHGSRQSVAPYVTANVNLWPKTVALLANTGRFSKLTDEQQGWLRQAAREAAMASVGLFEPEDELVASICEAGGRLANASPTDLAGLQLAFAPAYTSLEQDPETKGFIEAILQLKASTPAGPALSIPTGCTGPAPNQTTYDPIAGTWETGELTENQIVRAFVTAGGSEKEGHAFFAQLGGGATKYAAITIAFHDGSFSEHESGDGKPAVPGGQATYTVDSDGTYTMTDETGCSGIFRYELSGNSLLLHIVEKCPGPPYGATLFGSFPFTRVSEGQAPNDPVAGTWTAEAVTETEWVHAFIAGGGSEKEAHSSFGQALADGKSWTLQFEKGFVTLVQSDGSIGYGPDPYEIDADGVLTMRNSRCVGTYRFVITADTLRLYVVKQCDDTDAPYNTALFASFPLTRSG